MLDLRRETIYFWYYFSVQFEQIFGYWVLGMLIGSFISVFIKNPIHNLFRSIHSKRLGAFGIPIASALGIASPLCMYGTIPIAASFSRSGMSDDWLAAFMMSSILLNPQLIIYSAALGPTALVIRIAASFLCGIAAGVLTRVFYKLESTKFSVLESLALVKNNYVKEEYIGTSGCTAKSTALRLFIKQELR